MSFPLDILAVMDARLDHEKRLAASQLDHTRESDSHATHPSTTSLPPPSVPTDKPLPTEKALPTAPGRVASREKGTSSKGSAKCRIRKMKGFFKRKKTAEGKDKGGPGGDVEMVEQPSMAHTDGKDTWDAYMDNLTALPSMPVPGIRSTRKEQ